MRIEKWDIALEEARQYAENKMKDSYGDWDRKDEISLGVFYKCYMEYLEQTYSLVTK